jgi:glycosyltransferase involved in cell wall biosynthesis
MRVLAITPRFGEGSGGDGLYAYNLANALIKEGVEIEVLTVKNDAFVSINYSKAGRTGDYSILGKVENNPIEKNFYSRGAKRSLQAILEKRRPDVIHIHGIHQYFTVSAAQVLKEFSIPTLISIHDYKILCGNAGFFSNRTNAACVKCLQGQVLSPIGERCKNGSLIESIGVSIQMSLWKYLKALDAIDCFHCGSRFVFDLLKQNNQIAHKLVEIRLPYLRVPNNDKGGSSRTRQANIVFIGRLVAHKGITIFAEAVKEITEAVMDVFGDGPLFKDAKEILKNNRNVRFHGWKSHDEMEEYLFPGTIVVLPYLAYETFCFAALEAMLRGCCVVASNIGAIPELIRNNYNGICLNDPSPLRIREVVTELLTMPSRVLELGSNARKIKEELESLAQHSKRITELYKSLS